MPLDGLAVLNEEKLVADRGGEVAELGAGELEESGRLRTAPTLEKRERREHVGRRLAGSQVEFHLERDRIARGGGSEIGWKQEAEHGCVRVRKPGISCAGATQKERPMSNEAFTQLVDAHYAPLYRFALSLARREADACDLVQQTFYIWATKGDALREMSKAKSWLFTTLYREFLRGRRRDTRATSIEDLPLGEQDIAAEDVDRVARLDAMTVVAALHSVDEVFRAPLTLFYLEDLSYLEIAEALEVPIGTVMSRLSRGKAQLRAALARKESAAKSTVISFPGTKGEKQA